MRVDLVDAGLPLASARQPAWSCWQVPATGRFACPSTGLYLLAACSPPGVEVRVIDEKVAGAYEPAADTELVAISFKTMDAARAYALADQLRGRKLRVVLGGVHASLLPDEAGLHADAVVVGEADELWPVLLADAQRGELRPCYRSERRPDIRRLAPQRTDLVPHRRYLFHAIQSARGCSLDCEFCPTRHMFGEGFRLRDLDIVEAEARALLGREDKPIFFCDDIFGAGEPRYIAELAERLGALSARYAFIGELKVLGAELLDTLARTGCLAICVNMPGTCSDDEVRAVEAVRQRGISVWGYFMFGFEFHRADVFERCASFVRRTQMEGVFLTLLAPYAGTPMAARLRAEQRILSDDWSRYDQSQVVVVPKGMSAAELEEGYARIGAELEDLWGLPRIWEGLSRRLGSPALERTDG